MLTIGLTGGIGFGQEHGRENIVGNRRASLYVDKVAHLTYVPSGPAYGKVVEAFGRDILDADGEIDLKKARSDRFSPIRKS